MSTTTPTDEEALAQRIASRGREALAERLSRAYRAAAGAHADLVTLDGERIDALARAALDRADGLQWRRSLATVAAQELGVSLDEAYSHPTVARAQAFAGAPSYEQSLSELSLPAAAPAAVAAPEPAATPATDLTDQATQLYDVTAEFTDEPEPDAAEPDASAAETAPDVPEPDAVAAPDAAVPEAAAAEMPDSGVAAIAEAEVHDTAEMEAIAPAVAPAPDFPAADAPDFPAATTDPEAPVDTDAPAADTPATDAPAVDAPTAVPAVGAGAGADHLSVAAIHLGGVANLPTKREGLELRLSESGLDILHEGGEIIGRLPWDEIDSLQVPNVRARRRNHSHPRLLVRTPHGDATFEIPGFDAEELRGYVDPLVARFVHH